MKKYLLFALSIFTNFIAAQDQPIEVGRIHNEVLAYAKPHIPDSGVNYQLSETLVKEFLSTKYDFDDFPDLKNFENVIIDMYQNPNISISVGLSELTMQFLRQDITNPYQDQINSVLNVITSHYSSDPEQMYNQLSQELKRIKPNLNYEIQALAEIADYSARFWKGDEGNSGSTIQAIVQLDCVGYIIGWGAALIEDHYNGGINPQGGNRRIRAGLYGAAFTSVGGFKF